MGSGNLADPASLEGDPRIEPREDQVGGQIQETDEDYYEHTDGLKERYIPV
jgi:hypothetical protein